MAKRRFAIITYDPDRIAELNWQAEGSSFCYAILRGISGLSYAKERDIINITLMGQVPVASAAHERVK